MKNFNILMMFMFLIAGVIFFVRAIMGHSEAWAVMAVCFCSVAIFFSIVKRNKNKHD